MRIVVLDEADEMADMGFLPPIKRILKQIRPDAQHMLFSATLDHGVDEVVSEFLHDPKVHSVDEVTSNVDSMTHHLFLVSRNDKAAVVRSSPVDAAAASCSRVRSSIPRSSPTR